MNDSPRPVSALGPWCVRFAALWILAGALFKLLIGSPNDLPASVKDLSAELLGLGATRTFQLAIAIEISIALPALLRPRLVWPLVAAQLGVFCAVLVPLVLAGAKSCGCFGSKIPFPPWAMLAIDGALLLALLATRPWRARAARRQLLLPLTAGLIAAWVLPFVMVPTGGLPVSPADGDGAPTGLPRFVELTPAAWVGQPIGATQLGALIDVDLYPQDATWVIYSPTCDHCAAYLRQLDGDFFSDPRLYVFVRLPGDEGMPRAVDAMPPGEEAVLPEAVAYVITPPWALELEGGVVTRALHPEDV